MKVHRTTGSAAALTVCLLALLWPAPVDGQELTRTFRELEDGVEEGERLFITATDGTEISGLLVDLSRETLTLELDGIYREWTPDAVRRIERRDGLLNGMMIGLGAGFGFGALAADRGWLGPFSVPFMTGGGLGIGTAIDALIGGRELVFLGGGQRQKTVSAAPVLSPTRKEVTIGLRF